jgi:hypothetical protein
MTEQMDTSTQMLPKRGRGRAAASDDLIEAMREIAEAAQPITGRGVGYKLFTKDLIDSMAQMPKVYKLLKIAREEGTIPWEWIVDETRKVERVPTWADPEEFSDCVATSYRRDFWKQQPERCEVWSEKGTIRGLLKPVLDEYAVDFRVLHGFGPATILHEVAEDDSNRDELLNILYVGDYDPSGMFMSEVDIPKRLEKYGGGGYIAVKRIALVDDGNMLNGLSSFPASDKGPKNGKGGDPRYKWFVKNYGRKCWEIDAMDPTELRDLVEVEIKLCIEPGEWGRCEKINRAEQASLRTVLDEWKGARL